MNGTEKRPVSVVATGRQDENGIELADVVCNCITQRDNLSISPHVKFNKITGLWEIWRNGRVEKTCFTRLYASTLIYRTDVVYRHALAHGDPVPWPDDDVPFNGEPCYGDDDIGLEPRDVR